MKIYQPAAEHPVRRRGGHIHALGTWHINANWEAKGDAANTTDWGTDRYTALELIEDALESQRRPRSMTRLTTNRWSTRRQNGGRPRESRNASKSGSRSGSGRMTRAGNGSAALQRHVQPLRVRTFNGDHLTLPGASGAIQLHGHQKAGVWRILQTPNTLLAHVVGAGKTFTMVAAAMELKRLGWPASRCSPFRTTCSASFHRTADAVSRREHPGRGQGGL